MPCQPNGTPLTDLGPKHTPRPALALFLKSLRTAHTPKLHACAGPPDGPVPFTADPPAAHTAAAILRAPSASASCCCFCCSSNSSIFAIASRTWQPGREGMERDP